MVTRKSFRLERLLARLQNQVIACTFSSIPSLLNGVALVIPALEFLLSFSIWKEWRLTGLLRRTAFAVWGDALEAIDASLRDITSVNEPFGGESMLLSSDFPQIRSLLLHVGSLQDIKAQQLHGSPNRVQSSYFSKFSESADFLLWLESDSPQDLRWKGAGASRRRKWGMIHRKNKIRRWNQRSCLRTEPSIHMLCLIYAGIGTSVSVIWNINNIQGLCNEILLQIDDYQETETTRRFSLDLVMIMEYR